MNKKLILIIVLIILLISAALTYVLLRPNNNSVVNELTSETVAPELMEDETTEEILPANDFVATSMSYQDYSDKNFSETDGIKLLFFHAPWCPQCREIEESIKENGVPSGVTVFKVDYDSNQKLRQKYGITIQTTFVKVDGDGNKVASYVAYEEPNFSSVERELLN